MKFSVVMPVHNEEQVLPYTLPSVFALKPDELIFIMDRCTDNSLNTIMDMFKASQLRTNIDIHFIEAQMDYLYRPAGLRRLGYAKATNDAILNVSADIVLDPIIKKHILDLDMGVKMVRFGYLDWPYNLRCFLRQIYSRYTPFKSMSGLYAFSKSAYDETEDLEDLKKQFSEDTHLIMAVESTYKTRYYNTKSFHLRTDESVEYDVQRGINYQRTMQMHPLKAFLYSMGMLRPHLFLSYVRYRDGRLG